MDYHKLKRKELQALCKEHNIPANSANSVLADKLSELLNVKQKPDLKRPAKKVRFSPDDDLVEFEQLQSAEKPKVTVRDTRSRRQSLATKAEAVESVDSTENPVRRTRSSKADVDPSNEEKKGRRIAKDTEKEVDIEKDIKDNTGKVTRSKAHASQKGGGEQSKENKKSRQVVKNVEKESEPVKEAVVGRARVTRSKAQTVEGGAVPEVNTRGKKKNDKQIEADGQSDEADKGTVDVPVRATRSSRQTVKEDIVDVVGNSLVDKKRTRRQMKATDLSSNSSQTAPVDKQEPLKRKSQRTRVVETGDGDEDGKVEVVKGSRATRSKAPIVMEGSGRNGKNKPNKVEIHQVEEPLKHDAGKRFVNRRKSVFQPEKVEADVDLDEPVNLPVGMNTRRKSVLPKATKKVEPPVRKNQSKAQFGKEAASESPKLRKGKGTLIIKDPVIEAGHGSSVKSPKSSARSTSKSAGKPVVTKASKKVKSPVVKKQSKAQEATSESSKSRKRKGTPIKSAGKPVVQVKSPVVKKQSKAQSGKEATLESPKSRKRKGTPITEDLIIETDYSSPVVKSPRGSTRSTSKSAGKSGKFILDPAVNTAPGRITRSGFKHGGDTAGSFSEQIGKKQKSKSAYKKQPDVDAQMAVPEAAEVGPDLGEGTTGVRSAVKQLLDETQTSTPEVEEVQPNPDTDLVGPTGVRSAVKQLLDETHMSTPEVEEVQPNPDMDPVGIPGSESVMLPTKMAEENRVSVSGPSIIASLVSGENASEETKEDSGAPVEKLSNEESSSPRLPEAVVSGNQQDPTELHVFNDETSLGENLSHFDTPTVSVKDVVENVPDPVSDVSNLQDQNEEVYVESGNFSESLKLGTSVIKSGRPDTEEKEMERTESGSSLKRLQTDGLVEEPLVSVSKSDGEDDSDGTFKEQKLDSVAQPSCSVTDDSMLSERDGEDEAVTINVEPESSPDALDAPLVSMQAEPISEPPANDVIETPSGNDMSGNPLMEEGGVHDDGINEPKELGTGLEQSTVEPESSPDALDTPLVSMQAEPISEPPANDVLETPSGIDTSGNPLMEEGDVPDDGVNEPKELGTGSEQATANKSFEVPEEDDVQGDDLETPSGNDMSGNPLMEEGDVLDDGINEPKEFGTGSEQSTANKSFEVPEEDDVEGDDPEPAQNVSVPLLPEVLVRSGDQEREQMANIAADDVPFATSGNDDIAVRVDALEQSAVDISKDVVSSILGDTYEIDAEDDSGSEQVVTESDGGFQPKESGGAAPDMIDEQLTEQANDRTLDDQDHAAETHDLDSDDDIGNVMNHSVREQASPIVYMKEDSSHRVGDIDAHESRTMNESLSFTCEKEEPPVEAADLDLPTMTDDGRPMQGADGSFLPTPATARISERDAREDADAFPNLDTYSSLTPSVPTPGTTQLRHVKDAREDATGSASQDYHSSLKQLLKTPAVTRTSHAREDAAGSDSQDYHSSLKQSLKTPAVTRTSYAREDAAGSDIQDYHSSLKQLLKTPAVTRTSHAREDAAGSDSQDYHSSLKQLLKTPAVTRTSHAREDAAGSDSQDYHSSLKQLLKTPAVTRTSHAREDAAGSDSQDYHSSLKQLLKTPTVTRTSHAHDGQEKSVSFADQDPYSSQTQMFTTQAKPQISHIKNSREDATASVNVDPYSSLKVIFATPDPTKRSHIKNSREDATASVHEDSYLSLKTMFATPAPTQSSHFKNSREDATASVIEDACEPQGSTERDSGSEMYKVQGSEDYHLNLDEDTSTQFDFKGETQGSAEGVSGDEMYEVQGSEVYHLNLDEDTDAQFDFKGETHGTAERVSNDEMYGDQSFGYYNFNLNEDTGAQVEFKGVHVDPTQEFDFTSEGPETSHGDFSGLKDDLIHGSGLGPETSRGDFSGLNDNSIHSSGLEKKEDRPMKKQEPGDDLAFSTGGAGNSGYSNE